MKHKKFSLDAVHKSSIMFFLSRKSVQVRVVFFQYKVKKLPRNEKKLNWSFIPFLTVFRYHGKRGS